MTVYYINQNFSFFDRFTIKDENKEDVFFAEEKALSFAKKIHLKAMDGEEILRIEEEVFSFLSHYNFYIGEENIAELKKEMSFFKPRYKMAFPNWSIEGNIWEHHYEIKEEGDVIARIDRKLLSFMDAYEIEIFKKDYDELVLGIVIAIDADLAKDD